MAPISAAQLRGAVRKAAPVVAALSVLVWGLGASSLAATHLPRLLRADVSSRFAGRPATITLGCCGQLIVGGPGVSAKAFGSGKRGRIRWKDWGSSRADGSGLLWIDNGVPSCGSRSFRPHQVSIEAFGARNGRYTELRLVYRLGRRRVSDLRRLERVRGTKPAAFEWFGSHTRGGLAPSSTSGGAGSVTQVAANLAGTVNSNGRYTTYYFEYGTSTSYGAATARRGVRAGRRAVSVTASLTGLSPGTTYHYRIYASNAAGPACSSDRTFTTVMTPQQLAASRAVATYNAIQQDFYAPHVYSGDTSSLYTENYPQSGNRYCYLWPFSRVLAGTITLAGIPSTLLGGANYQADVADRLTGLSRFWENTPPAPGYASYPAAPYGVGGDKYYDDDAWVGLASAENYALTGDPTSLADAKNAFNFVFPSGWAGTASYEPGGIYWVNQGIGVGAGNHDRTTTSNAPNAEVALLLENFDPANAPTYDAAATNIYAWVDHYLYNVNTNPTDPTAPNPNYDPNQPALMLDKVTGQNTIDETLYTYNQGTMIAANVREYQKTGNPMYLSEAEAIARTALSTFNESYYISHSAAFNAIYFRGLLVLYSVTSDTQLQSEIIQTIQTYASDAWANHRSVNGLFTFASHSGNGYQLLDQGAMLQIYAMLAWDPSEYGKLP
ncbi:MAG TPA: glycoside hydrolase family 76 protein [Solirubrobacteraceae bacterium]|nr:glycoside hydrolase family 76 protein [Solirubrobacteraceae bacterium]